MDNICFLIIITFVKGIERINSWYDIQKKLWFTIIHCFFFKLIEQITNNKHALRVFNVP